MGNLKKTSIFIFGYFCLSCNLYEPISIPQTPLNENFKLNGYYYHKYDGGYNTYFFYTNGVVFTYGTSSYNGNDLKLLDDSIRENLAVYEKTRYFWGLYTIENKNIKIEKWVSTSGSKYPTNLFEGEVIGNDRFKLVKKTGTDKYTKKNKPVTIINQEFTFRQFKPKPDSTNSFIK